MSRTDYQQLIWDLVANGPAAIALVACGMYLLFRQPVGRRASRMAGGAFLGLFAAHFFVRLFREWALTMAQAGFGSTASGGYDLATVETLIRSSSVLLGVVNTAAVGVLVSALLNSGRSP